MAVRLAIKAALAPMPTEGGAPDWPTVAEDRIFDSRFDLLDGRGGERTPLIIVAVEAIEGSAFSAQNGAGAGSRGFDLTARIVMSAQVTSRQRFRGDDGEEFEAEAADLLDHELADLLAILQEQAWLTLKSDPLFNKVVLRTGKLDAEPYPSDETGEKLAVLANSLFIEPLADGEKALGLVADLLPAGSPVRARAEAALSQLDKTRATLVRARQRRAGFAPAPFAAGLAAQGVSPTHPPPADPPAPSAIPIAVTLDPKEPIP